MEEADGCFAGSYFPDGHIRVRPAGAPHGALLIDRVATKAPLMTLKGTVKADGDKVSFVSDKNQKKLGRDESRRTEGR